VLLLHVPGTCRVISREGTVLSPPCCFGVYRCQLSRSPFSEADADLTVNVETWPLANHFARNLTFSSVKIDN
jgi:hypothetical protein